jgi:hypothetical protein
MKNTNVILYPGGAYGHFINWCCSYFSGLINDPIIPMTETGSVHNLFAGNSGIFYRPQLENYLNSIEEIPFIQTHIDYDINNHRINYSDEDWVDSVNSNLAFIDQNFKKSIYIYQTVNSVSCLINNSYYKVKPADDFKRLDIVDPMTYLQSLGFSDQKINQALVHGVDRLKLELADELDPTILAGWGHTSIDQFATWELRELGSKYFYDKCMAKIYPTEMIKSLKGKYKNIEFIELNQLRDNFELTILLILKTFNIDLNKQDSLNKIYNDWLPYQQHINKDRQIAQIIEAVINNVSLDWSSFNLTIFDEIFIQRKLLDNNISIKCWQLNNFPTNTKNLLPLLERQQ